MKTVQQRGVTDFSAAVHRNYVLNHVVLAEINFFQREKVDDFSNYFKTFVDEQIKFYEDVNSNEIFRFYRSIFCILDYIAIT